MEVQGKETLFKIIFDTYDKRLVPKDYEKCLMIPYQYRKRRNLRNEITGQIVF